MGTVKQLLREKGQSIQSLPADASVLDAAKVMNRKRIGSVLVLEGDRLTGIFTERDVLTRVVATQLDPAQTRIGEVMTTAVAVGAPDTTLDEVRALMREKRIRHLPILAGRQVVGMISIGDLNRAEQRTQQETIRYLEMFMYQP